MAKQEQAQTEGGFNNPALYRELQKPFESVEKLNDSIRELFDKIYAARCESKIMDVHIIISANVLDKEGREGMVMTSSHIGASNNGEPMAAYALGFEQAERQENIARMMKQSIKAMPRIK